MRAVRHFGVILLLLLSCLAPVMACAAPDAQMTAAERACCRMMRNQCSQMEMPVSQNCCGKAASAFLDTALKSNPLKFQSVATSALSVAAFDVLTRDRASQASIQGPEHWPPKSPPAAITVLRI
jgi:hypothetical protein